MNSEDVTVVVEEQLANWSSSNVYVYWEHFMNEYGLPIGQYFISIISALYARLTILHVTMFVLRCIPTGIYMHAFMTNVHKKSRERLKQQQTELEDLQLQIQIINTKLSIEESAFSERVGDLKKSIERLRKVRARVRQMVQSDEELRHTINSCNSNCSWDDFEENVHSMPDGECELLVELLKGLKGGQVPEFEPKGKGGESSGEPMTHDDSIYSSTSDDRKQDCHIKIVKVTNVFRVAYLKHCIKQKRLRRAKRRAQLKKKSDNIKKILEDWQKTLNMVINNKLALLSMHPLYTPQEAMGDCSHVNYRDYSDSDSDFRNTTDNAPDEYGLSWSQIDHRNMCYDEYETAVSREPYEEDVAWEKTRMKACDRRLSGPGYLVPLPEETLSQMAIEEIRSEASEDGDSRDLVAM